MTTHLRPLYASSTDSFHPKHFVIVGALLLSSFGYVLGGVALNYLTMPRPVIAKGDQESGGFHVGGGGGCNGCQTSNPPQRLRGTSGPGGNGGGGSAAGGSGGEGKVAGGRQP